MAATGEAARGDLLVGVYAHGHRVKNVLGVIGARVRSTRRVAEGEVVDRLREVEHEVTALYEEWSSYLRSMESQRPSLEVVHLEALLREVVIAVSARTVAPITVEVSPGVGELRGDRVLLREALHNLLANAAEACVATGGSVRVIVRPTRTDSSPRVELTVVDTGVGIAREHLARVFAPGYTTKDTGSGVGLTIAERVVIAHDGHISIASEEGRGTTITVTLPTELGGVLALSPIVHPGER
jgi:two-component system sensor histidine kinase AtoS